MFGLNIDKLVVLAVLAIIIFGPDQLPKIAAQAGTALRELRRMAQGASDDLREGLGPEFADFDLADLHPRTFVRKHLLDDFGDPFAADPVPATAGQANAGQANAGEADPVLLDPGEPPPYDAEAT